MWVTLCREYLMIWYDKYVFRPIKTFRSMQGSYVTFSYFFVIAIFIGRWSRVTRNGVSPDLTRRDISVRILIKMKQFVLSRSNSNIYIQLCELRQVGGFLWFFSTNKTDRQDITEILLKVALNTINQTKPNRDQLSIGEVWGPINWFLFSVFGLSQART
jgi:hypothetical protein